MIVFRIQGKDFPLDDSVAYRDYYLMGGRAVLADVQWAAVLADVQSGRLALDDGLAGEIAILDRWVAEAPRKRHYREMARTPGTAVLSGEEFFTHDGGEAIIDALERTGQVARRFLEAFFPRIADVCKGPPERHPARQHIEGDITIDEVKQLDRKSVV